MKVFAFIKIRKHPMPNGPGAQYGDLISFHRTDQKLSKDELHFFIPVQVDITIPCGDTYDKGSQCKTCEYNDPLTCDVQNFCRGEWGDGSLFEEPALLKTRRFKVDIKKEIPRGLLTTAEKLDKTQEEQDGIVTAMKAITLATAKIIDKAK